MLTLNFVRYYSHFLFRVPIISGFPLSACFVSQYRDRLYSERHRGTIPAEIKQMKFTPAQPRILYDWREHISSPLCPQLMYLRSIKYALLVYRFLDCLVLLSNSDRLQRDCKNKSNSFGYQLLISSLCSGRSKTLQGHRRVATFSQSTYRHESNETIEQPVYIGAPVTECTHAAQFQGHQLLLT